MIVWVDEHRQKDENQGEWVRLLFFHDYPCRTTLFIASNIADALKLEGGKSYRIEESPLPYPAPCPEWDKYFGVNG